MRFLHPAMYAQSYSRKLVSYGGEEEYSGTSGSKIWHTRSLPHRRHLPPHHRSTFVHGKDRGFCLCFYVRSLFLLSSAGLRPRIHPFSFNSSNRRGNSLPAADPAVHPHDDWSADLFGVYLLLLRLLQVLRTPPANKGYSARHHGETFEKLRTSHHHRLELRSCSTYRYRLLRKRSHED